jgi:hypothetical protein
MWATRLFMVLVVFPVFLGLNAAFPSLRLLDRSTDLAISLYRDHFLLTLAGAVALGALAVKLFSAVRGPQDRSCEIELDPQDRAQLERYLEPPTPGGEGFEPPSEG